MTRNLRQRHILTIRVLALLLPAAFFVSLAARKPFPAVGATPSAFQNPQIQYKDLGITRTNLFAKVPVTVRLLEKMEHPRQFSVELSGDRNMLEPDLIVYWIPDGPANWDKLPDAAMLLGSYGAAALDLPDQAMRSRGVLVLYSLANGEILDISKPISLPPSN